METKEKCTRFTLLPELIVKSWEQDGLDYYVCKINWIGFETSFELTFKK